jgi:WD40 repeat protein
MRNMGEEYQIFNRVVETNQRIYFDVSRNDRYLISGGSDGCIRLWDMTSSEDKSVHINTSTDCVNGVSLNPFVPLLATASGQRHFPDISDDRDSDDMFVDSSSKVKEAKEIKLWKCV